MPYRIQTSCIGCSLCKKICPVDAIRGLAKKLHVIDADRCIDCGACGRICPQEAVLDAAGVACRRTRIRSRWPKPLFDLQHCAACGVCIEVCPVSCLEFSRECGSRATVRYPLLQHRQSCIACGFCAADCPLDAIKMDDA